MSYCCLNEQKQVDEVVSKDPDDPCEVVAYVPPLQPVRDKVVQTVTIGRLGWLQPVGCTERIGKIKLHNYFLARSGSKIKLFLHDHEGGFLILARRYTCTYLCIQPSCSTLILNVHAVRMLRESY